MIETELAQIISLLVDVQGLTLKPEHKTTLRRLITSYPNVDVKSVMEKWVAGTADKPLDKKSRPGTQWVTWVKLANEKGWERRKVPAEVVMKPQQDKFRLINWGAR